eukprot:XP_011666325.1 PREDICTED: dual oxidase-like [Strongylocentrotus purpuratus]
MPLSEIVVTTMTVIMTMTKQDRFIFLVIISLTALLATGESTLCGENESREHHELNGWYNNRADPRIGTYETRLLRRLPVGYPDGAYSPAGPNRPNPLTLSNLLMHGKSGIRSENKKSALLAFFGEYRCCRPLFGVQ